MQSSERSERENFGGIEKKIPYRPNEILGPEVGICICIPLTKFWGTRPLHPGCSGGGVGTLLQNVWKMLFKQKYFYLLKIFGGMGTTPLSVRSSKMRVSSFDSYIFRMHFPTPPALHIKIYAASRGFLAIARLLCITP